MHLLKCLYQATKVSQRRHVFVKVPVPSHGREMSCVCVRGIDFVTRSLVLCVCFVDHCYFVLLLLTIVLYVLFTDSDYSCGIFKLFLLCFYYIDFELLLQCGIFLFFILIPMFFVVVCVCVSLALRNNGETLCICCILFKLYIYVLLIAVCQS